MKRTFGWDYPPGVTGNEPEIAGCPDEPDTKERRQRAIERARKRYEVYHKQKERMEDHGTEHEGN